MAEPRLTIDDAYHWEKTNPDRIWLTQPIGDGKVETYTWAQAMDQVRRMAAHLKSLNLEPGSHIGLISKNCAHFILADLAIWMAGHVSVALYPTLNADTLAGDLAPRVGARRLIVGSCKTNVGHLEGAAGIVGVLKTVLALKHKTLPPHLHPRDASKRRHAAAAQREVHRLPDAQP